ncbi:late competence development ComFB family protein [candidate division KSB1 bacterium]
MADTDEYMIDDCQLFNIRNLNEVEVVKAIRVMRDRYPDFCNCCICIEDVYALALNLLSPKYKQQSSIILQDKIDPDEVEDIVEKAIQRIMDHPNHPD